MRDRRTLQRVTTTSFSTPNRQRTLSPTKRERRISLPVSPSTAFRRISFGASLSPPPPSSNAATSSLPELGLIPPTPLEEKDNITYVDSPQPLSPSSDSSSCRPISLFALDSTKLDEQPTYRVIEDYSAPVWVPDSKADRCMRCNEMFGVVLRRKHHCRLCGAVVCWECSEKVRGDCYHFISRLYRMFADVGVCRTVFIIPSHDENGTDRLARACDSCYDNVFPPTPSINEDSSQQLSNNTNTPTDYFSRPAILSPQSSPPLSPNLRFTDSDGLPINDVEDAFNLDEGAKIPSKAVGHLTSLLQRR